MSGGGQVEYSATVFNGRGWLPERLSVIGDYVEVATAIQAMEFKPGQAAVIHRADADLTKLQQAFKLKPGGGQEPSHLVHAVHDAARSHFRVGLMAGIAATLVVGALAWALS